MGILKRRITNLVKEQAIDEETQVIVEMIRVKRKEHMKLPRSVYIVMAAVAISLFASGCDDFCGFRSYIERGTWQDFHGIFTVVEPADLELYRELLPAEMEMPERPAVGVFIVDYVIVVPCPMRPYLEGALGIRGEYNGEDSWHVVTMPVNLQAACDGGLRSGFPKYMADEITLAQSGENWEGVVTHEGVIRMSLEFTPGLTRELEPFEVELMSGGLPRLEVPMYQLVPPGEGPELRRITLESKVPDNWESTQGMVEIHISPDDPWAGLIDSSALAPAGLFMEFTGGKVMDSEKVN
jgi:hypothetical protein